MAKKNSTTAGEAVQAQATPAPTVPGVTPTTGDTPAADGTSGADDDAEPEDAEHDDVEPEEDDEHDQEVSPSELLAELVGVRQQVRQLQAEKAALQEQLTAERQRSGEAAGELNEAQTLIEELQKRLERADTREAQSGTPIVSHGEVDYKVLAPKFQFEGKVYQAADLKDDAALVAKLVAAEVGFLHKIEAGA